MRLFCLQILFILSSCITFAQSDTATKDTSIVKRKTPFRKIDDGYTIRYLNDLTNNPAFLSYNGTWCIGTVWQHTYLNNSYIASQTNNRITYSSPRHQRMNWGLRYQSGEDGLYKTSIIGISYSANWKLTRISSLAIGIETQYNKVRFDWNKATLPDMIDYTVPSFFDTTKQKNPPAITVASFSMGTIFIRPKFVAQLQVDNPTAAGFTFYRTPGEGNSNYRRYSAVSIYEIRINENIKILPAISWFNNRKGGILSYHVWSPQINLKVQSFIAGVEWSSNESWALRLSLDKDIKSTRSPHSNAHFFRMNMLYRNLYGISEFNNVKSGVLLFNINYSLRKWSRRSS